MLGEVTHIPSLAQIILQNKPCIPSHTGSFLTIVACFFACFLCLLAMCLLLIGILLDSLMHYEICVFGLFHSTYIYNSYKPAYSNIAVTRSVLDIDA